MDRQAVFHLITKLEDMIGKGGVFFPSEGDYADLICYYEGEFLFERALEVAEYAILQYSLSPQFHLNKAEILLQICQPEQALAALDKADLFIPGSLSSSLLRAEGYAALETELEAIRLLDELKGDSSSEDLSNIYVQEALIYHNQKEHEREFYTLKAALTENPTNQEALSRMWYCVESARKHEESVELHKSIIEVDPFCSLAWYNLGTSQQYLCNYKEAVEAFEFAYLSNPDFEFAYRSCAEVCIDQQDYQKALQCYQDILERFEADDDLFLCIGKCYEKLGSHPVAITFLEKALELNPMNDEAFFLSGVCYSSQSKWKEAIDFLLEAVRINDLNEEYFSALAEAFFKTGNLKEAEIHFKAAADAAPEMATHWIRLSKYYLDTHQIEEALEVLDEAEEYTYGSEILYYRSAFLFKKGLKREALMVLEEALCEDFSAHDSMFNLLPVMANDSEVKAVISIFQPDQF